MTEANGRGFDNLIGTSVWPGAICIRPGMSYFPYSRGLYEVALSLTAKIGEPNNNANVGIKKPSLSASPYVLGWVELDSWLITRVCAQVQR